MLNHLKEQLGLAKDGNSTRIDRHVTVRLLLLTFLFLTMTDQLDLIDTDGNTKEIYTVNTKNYAIQYLNPTTTYIVVKIENSTDPSATNEKKFIPLVNENFLNANMMSKYFLRHFSKFN